MCEMGHKRGSWGFIYDDVELCFMPCDVRTYDVANGTMESGVMRMGEEPSCKTTILDHGLIKFLIEFF